MTETTKRKSTYQISGAPALSRTNLELMSIDPNRGAKYSPNLYAYLKRKAKGPWLQLQRVFKDEQGGLWMGYFDDVGHFNGAKMGRVLTEGGKAETFCYVNLGGLREIEGFWDHYIQDGRCAIDPQHEMYFVGERWRTSEDGNSRSCLWCGKAHQFKHDIVTTKVVHSTEWRSTPPAAS